jgi:phosphatidylserine decarboxylase
LISNTNPLKKVLHLIANDLSARIFLITLTVLGVGILFVSFLFNVLWPWALGSLFFFVPAILVALFFRDPPRHIGEGIVSPADGKVVIIDTKKGSKRICIFMNVHNVHVNRVPYGGTVTGTNHQPGGFIPAMNKDAETNERFITSMNTDIGKIKIVQIAGIVARRIVPYLEAEDVVKKGDKLGHIAFGSRVDLYLPKSRKIVVEVGQKVLAGKTTVGW